MSKASHNRHGSHAGRGFRYQDAVTVMLALQVWGGMRPPAIIIPEGNDDVEWRSSGGNGLVQIKSRRGDLGGLPLSDARKYIAELWERRDKFAPPAVRLELVFEQGVIDHEAAADGCITPNAKLVSLLPDKARGEGLLAKTVIWHASSPYPDSIAIIVSRKGCSLIAAALCVARLLQEVGILADGNGRLKAADYRGLSASDTDRIVTETLGAIDVEAIEEALRNGACEAADFLTPFKDPEFYLGVDVQPGHVVAGLVIPRLQSREMLMRSLETRRAALVVGPSGSGKSAIMWDAAYALRHTIRWHRLLRVDQQDLPALRRLVRTLRAHPESPVGFVVDDIGRRGADGWDALTLEFAAVPGVVLLGSIREEDLFLLQGRSRAGEMRAEPDERLARRIFEELKRKGRTEWVNWREPWTRSQGLTLEYVHILTAGRRFHETLGEQVDARRRDATRSAELSILRLLALTGAVGASADAERLPAILSLSEEDVGRSLSRLIDEHLVRRDANGGLTGLHQLRSAELTRLTHAVPPPPIATTFARAARVVSPRDLELLTADGMRNHGVEQGAAIAALSARLQAEPSLEALSAALRGLGTAWIARGVEVWLATEHVKALPRTQVGTAVFFELMGNTITELSEHNETTRTATAAAADLKQIRTNAVGDPRHALLEALPVPLLAKMIADVQDPAMLDQFLSSLIGMSLHPSVRVALSARSIDLLTAPIESVARLLRTLAEFDRDEAIAWVDAVGEQALVSRIPHDVAWATSPTFENAPDGRIIRTDYHEIGIPGEDETHDRVVRLCEIALGLSPRSDIVVSAARAPNGEIVGFNGLSLADKRIPRENLPAATLQEWNRRWRDAIAIRVASSSYSGYLAKAVELLDRLAPALDRVLNMIIRNKSVTKAHLAAINGVHDAARELTPPAISSLAAIGEGADDVNANVTKLQNLLSNGSADVHQRFYKLPEDVGAFIAWTADLIKDADEIATQEPWGLVGGVPASLSKIRDLLIRVRNIAGEVAEGSSRPSVKFAKLLNQAKPDNPLRLASSAVEQRTPKARSQLATSIRSRLAEDGIEVEVYTAEDPKAILPWPPSKVLVVIPLNSHIELERYAVAATAARAAIPDSINLTVLPKIDRWVLPARSLRGHQTLLPLSDEADAWVKQLDLPFFRPEISPVLGIAVATASALHSMDRLKLGVAGRSFVELEMRERLEDELSSRRALLAAMVDGLEAGAAVFVLSQLDRIRTGEANVATGLGLALDEAEFERWRMGRNG